jgi:hypothetical protein
MAAAGDDRSLPAGHRSAGTKTDANEGHSMELDATMSFHEADLGRYVSPLCFCGSEVAPALARLGSVLCHDCRDDPERARSHQLRPAVARTVDRTGRGQVLAALHRLVSGLARGVHKPAARRSH